MLVFNSKKPIVSINLTPLVDVSLVLVVIFMATAPMFLQSGIAVYPGEKKSVADTAAANAADDSIIIKLTRDSIWVNEQKISTSKLAPMLTCALQRSIKKRVVIIPGDEVVHGDVIRALDVAKNCGAKKLVMMGNR